MDAIVAALAAQHAELSELLEGADLALPSACAGWSIGDVVLHLAQTDEMAIGSVAGRLPAVAGIPEPGSIDEGVDASVALERGAAPDELVARWRTASSELCAALRSCDPSSRCQWVAGTLAARTLATTRLAECWIHTGDVAFGLGVELAPTERLWHIARLAWRTLPYAFEREGLTMHGPVAFRLTGPSGDAWAFGDDGAPTTIRGDGVDLCRVASRRVAPEATSLVGDGPDATTVLNVVRTWA